MKKLTKFLASIPVLSLSVAGLSFAPATAITSLAVNNQAVRTLLIAQGTSCNVINIQTGQLALRFAPNGKTRAGLDNGNTVEVIRNGSGVWSYVRVLNGPNSRVNGLEGWVNSNYLSCVRVAQSEDSANVIVFDPPSKVRTSPNGNILCTITNRRVIQVSLEPQGSWYHTSACGGGWIHDSQFRRIR